MTKQTDSFHLCLLEDFQVAVHGALRAAIALCFDFPAEGNASAPPLSQAFEDVGANESKRLWYFAPLFGFGEVPAANHRCTARTERSCQRAISLMSFPAPLTLLPAESACDALLVWPAALSPHLLARIARHASREVAKQVPPSWGCLRSRLNEGR
jgi:hypothetical protein